MLPGIFLKIQDLVRARIGVEGTIGEFDRERAMRLFPDLGLNVPVDWIAFGFPPQPFYDVHVGVILETGEWPVTCHCGLHVSSSAWPALNDCVARIDWPSIGGSEPDHTIAGSVHEHRFCDAPRFLDFANPDREAATLAARAVAYYLAARDKVTPR